MDDYFFNWGYSYSNPNGAGLSGYHFGNGNGFGNAKDTSVIFGNGFSFKFKENMRESLNG
jgi:hypothetical protein